jgi:hypothetical protein
MEKTNFLQTLNVLAIAALMAVSQTSFSAQPLVNKQFRLSSIWVTPMGPIYLYPDASTAANNDSGCPHSEIAISKSKPNYSELYSLVTAAMLAGKTLEISSGDFDGNKEIHCFEYGRATTNSIRMLN